jgi:broad specificity phosphatase PhoE
MLKIYIARHGQNVDNENGILNGHRDFPLTEKGREQALEVAGLIKDANLSFDAIYSSPLIRAFETAEIIAQSLNGPTPVSEDLLIERNFGIMTGEKVADIEKMCAPNILKTEIITYFIEVEGAETFAQMIERAKKLLEKLNDKHTDGNILLVCHGDIGKMIYAAYYNLGWEEVLKQFHFGNCELILLSEDSPANDVHVFRIKQLNH